MFSLFSRFVRAQTRQEAPLTGNEPFQCEFAGGVISLELKAPEEIAGCFSGATFSVEDLSALARKITAGFRGLFEYPITVDERDGHLLFTAHTGSHHQPLLRRFSPSSVAEMLNELTDDRGGKMFQGGAATRELLNREIASSRRVNEMLPLMVAKVKLSSSVELAHLCVARVVQQLLSSGELSCLDADVVTLIDEAIDEAVCSATETTAQLVEDRGLDEVRFIDATSVEKSHQMSLRSEQKTGPGKYRPEDAVIAQLALDNIWYTLEANGITESYRRESYIELVELTLSRLLKGE